MRLDGFGLFVCDMGKMIRFYRDVLGFEIREEERRIWRRSEDSGKTSEKNKRRPVLICILWMRKGCLPGAVAAME